MLERSEPHFNEEGLSEYTSLIIVRHDRSPVAANLILRTIKLAESYRYYFTASTELKIISPIKVSLLIR